MVGKEGFEPWLRDYRNLSKARQIATNHVKSRPNSATGLKIPEHRALARRQIATKDVAIRTNTTRESADTVQTKSLPRGRTACQAWPADAPRCASARPFRPSLPTAPAAPETAPRLNPPGRHSRGGRAPRRRPCLNQCRDEARMAVTPVAARQAEEGDGPWLPRVDGHRGPYPAPRALQVRRAVGNGPQRLHVAGEQIFGFFHMSDRLVGHLHRLAHSSECSTCVSQFSVYFAASAASLIQCTPYAARQSENAPAHRGRAFFDS